MKTPLDGLSVATWTRDLYWSERVGWFSTVTWDTSSKQWSAEHWKKLYYRIYKHFYRHFYVICSV